MSFTILSISTLILLIVGITLYIINKRLKEVEKEQNKINEKLKIHEILINMKAEIKELQKKVFK